jgi:superfamily II DNA or RNA helicase
VNQTRRARVETLVRTVSGLSALRPGQQAVIDAVLSRQHTLAIMPTGAGKSLCYQLPAMLLPGMTVRSNPVELEAKALRQWEAVEGRRRVLAAMTFPTLGSNTHPRVL